ncbi:MULTISPECIES: hypothetical protein [Methylomonas]|uniref:Uncharacterized protein n=2 Tax=Methylomonas TaxID=416 RepID=A0A140E6P8_9GAMM|nr:MULTISPECIES: hypothetical protein [Methylomonas]AMK79072.1 hypothetical protein JT25_021735 [Methylomonas denitrificans]OAI09283.1 hypothetical protein A1342_02825 [Methylomonas methanica]TCV79133.1 hypothetical protein EDE11_1216 [Methylomonas methanica]
MFDENTWNSLPLAERVKHGKLPEQLKISDYVKLSYPDPQSQTNHERREKLKVIRGYRKFITTVFLNACDTGHLAHEPSKPLNYVQPSSPFAPQEWLNDPIFQTKPSRQPSERLGITIDATIPTQDAKHFLQTVEAKDKWPGNEYLVKWWEDNAQTESDIRNPTPSEKIEIQEEINPKKPPIYETKLTDFKQFLDENPHIESKKKAEIQQLLIERNSTLWAHGFTDFWKKQPIYKAKPGRKPS